MTVNAWGGALHDPLVAWLPTIGADVACLQEMTRTPGLTGWTRFEDGERTLPQRASLVADVGAALPGYQSIFVASDSGPVFDAGGERHRQDFGVATLVAPRLPVIGIESEFVHGEFTDHDEWPTGDRPRNALAVHVPGVCVVQVHGLRDPAGKGDTAARRAQASRLAAFVGRIRRAGELVVLGGDLNLLPGSATFAILAGAGLTDLVGEADTRTARYRKPVRHASYLLVSDVSAVKHFEILSEPEVSDHRALVLDI